MTYFKTPTTAAMIGVPYHRLYSLLRYRVIEIPNQRDSSGHFLWTAEEVEAARQAIASIDALRSRVTR